MATEPSLVTEYATLTPLQIRITTHERFSERPDDPSTAVLDALALAGSEDLADIGSGDGRFLARLALAGHTGRLVGVDSSETMVAAAESIPGVQGVHGDAQQLPFGDNEFDVCTARHMLYHVPDPAAALSEFRRITRQGGTVAVVVNHARTCHRTYELVTTHARNHGVPPATGMINNAVNSETLPDMMRDAFGNTCIETFDNALSFDHPQPLIAFAESLFSFCGIAPENPHRAEIRAGVAADIECWFATHPGERSRDPKGYTVALASVTT
ncbi:class I SAM-dependent methyltransferase [Nocardia transvalensis]|uniref:class I SAM-dependent methyltransferase n=1 Tax=Nocardia transvalensis TaxID=37333 RepID=UPI001896022F|nr:class I SAM-dependent methyltransferase [Nocardia transvalensis]MBF6328426.1 class I SAM-dependent methyltransferase [Nocardia transvalensis]